MKKILVAVDSFENLTLGSPLLERTIELASAFSSKVWMLHVTPPSGHSPFNIDHEIFRREVAHELKDEHKIFQQIAKGLRERNIDATSIMVKGETIKTILNEADRLEVDLIIVGCHMHQEFVGAFTKDTARSLLGKCLRPIMFIPVID